MILLCCLVVFIGCRLLATNHLTDLQLGSSGVFTVFANNKLFDSAKPRYRYSSNFN